MTSPNGPALRRVIAAALTKEHIVAVEVLHLDSHGTGTSLGDPIEVAAQQAVLGYNRSKAAPVVIGAVKSNLGHLEAAAGMVGLLKIVISLHMNDLSPNLHLKQFNPHIDTLSYSALFPTEMVSIAASQVAGTSSFGFGGTNSHAVLGSEGHHRTDYMIQSVVLYNHTVFSWWGESPRVEEAPAVRITPAAKLKFSRPEFHNLRQVSRQAKHRCVLFCIEEQPGVALLTDSLFELGYDVLIVACGPLTLDRGSETQAVAVKLSAFSELPCVYIGFKMCAVWAYEVVQCLESMYTSATPTLLCVVSCQSTLSIQARAWCPAPIQTPIAEFWTDSGPPEYVSNWNVLTKTALFAVPATHAGSEQLVTIIEKHICSHHMLPYTEKHHVARLEESSTQIVVVGAGLTGLTVARRLVSEFDVRLLERSSSIGGVWMHQANGISPHHLAL